MKISKLFHWLYATLMLLPVLALGSSVLVNTFNNQAKIEVNVIYKYETNEVNSFDDLIVGNIYTVDVSTMSTQDGLCADYFSFTFFDGDDEEYKLFISDVNSHQFLYLYYDNHLKLDIDGYSTIEITSILNNEVDFVYNNDSFYSWQTSITNISKCENIPIERVEQKNITNVFYDSVDEIKSNDLFNWSSNTFFADAFVYIGSLFSIPSGSFIYLLLSYWFSISIIWMIFDMAIYVPLLIHRWLDKGVLK